MRRRKSSRTVNHPDQFTFQTLFERKQLVEVPQAPSQAAGALDYEQIVRQTLNEEIRNCPLDRGQIAEMLSSMVGRSITKTVLDTYTGASRPNRLPVDLLPALTAVLGPSFIKRIAEASGCHLMERNEVAMARIGEVFLIKIQAEKEIEKSIAASPLFARACHV